MFTHPFRQAPCGVRSEYWQMVARLTLWKVFVAAVAGITVTTVVRAARAIGITNRNFMILSLFA
jgi:hypothetical protein